MTALLIDRTRSKFCMTRGGIHEGSVIPVELSSKVNNLEVPEGLIDLVVPRFYFSGWPIAGW